MRLIGGWQNLGGVSSSGPAQWLGKWSKLRHFLHPWERVVGCFRHCFRHCFIHEQKECGLAHEDATSDFTKLLDSNASLPVNETKLAQLKGSS